MNSRFLKDSVDYSETTHVKKNILRPILEKYNEIMLDQSKIKSVLLDKSSYIVNNNRKYYLLILPKTNATQSYKILYFFPDSSGINEFGKNNINNKDFFLEIDYKSCFSKKYYLFEGYLYDNSYYYITDILYFDESVITFDYMARYNLINEILFSSLNELKGLNGYLTFGIHTLLDCDSKINLFQNNFEFKDQLVSIETVSHNSLKKSRHYYMTYPTLVESKIIIKSKYSDVYKVLNNKTNNEEGILYIKSLNDSNKMNDIFSQKTIGSSVSLKCEYNHVIKKWKPIF
jgi:hypothetical protein